MPERTLEQLKKGRAAAVARREPWLSSWRDAYRYTLPQRDIMDAPRPGQVKGNLVFDSTAVNSIAQGANRMQAAMMPPFQDLIIVEAGGAVPKEIKQQVDEKLSEAGEKFHGNLHRSNFAVAINEWLLDLFIGTATMLFLEGPDDDPFRFVPVAMPTVALEEGPWGSIGAHYRDHKVPLPVFREQWPEAKVPDGWMNKAKEDPAVEVPFHEVTYPDYREATWYYTLWSEEEDQILIDPHRAYDVHSPWLTARWTKAANEVYGRGPVLYALADIRTTNRVIELLLQNASLTVGGAYTVTHDGVVNP
ncbi:MAG: portal protein, partial [Alphaproteobacteria bacterium]|nr:portal protein [Alphaproteobacteria bacterium]